LAFAFRVGRVVNQEHVLRLEIAVHDAQAMRGPNGASDLRGNLPDRFHLVPELWGTRHAIAQGFALEQLHDQVDAPVLVHVAVEHVDDAGVVDERGRPRLGEEAGDHLVIARELQEKQLDRRFAVEMKVLCSIHLSRPTFA